MSYRDPMWPEEKIPAWIVYIVVAVGLFIFTEIYMNSGPGTGEYVSEDRG